MLNTTSYIQLTLYALYLLAIGLIALLTYVLCIILYDYIFHLVEKTFKKLPNIDVEYYTYETTSKQDRNELISKSDTMPGYGKYDIYTKTYQNSQAYNRKLRIYNIIVIIFNSYALILGFILIFYICTILLKLLINNNDYNMYVLTILGVLFGFLISKYAGDTNTYIQDWRHPYVRWGEFIHVHGDQGIVSEIGVKHIQLRWSYKVKGPMGNEYVVKHTKYIPMNVFRTIGCTSKSVREIATILHKKSV